EGYFERPRRANQAQLAEGLGISKQAFSRRLARVEENLFGQLLE
ncbi:MAG: putative DNA binding protein, partial [Halobacteriales archaeon]